MVNTNYKWTLRKGGGKMICPRCGQRRFVPYVSVVDGKTLAGPEFGRCDREQNCGYQRYPDGEIKSPEGQPQPIEEKEPLRFFPVAVKTDPDTPLFDYVARLLGVKHAIAIWQRYKIGRDKTRTVFWQIAADGSIRAGKSIQYMPNGHRDKTTTAPALWLHRCKNWAGMYTGEELKQCYFGEHLLRENTNAPVMIVESEKTAAVLSELSRKFVWLASGGSQGIKSEEKNRALKGRAVTLLPDNGQYWNWRTVADANGWEILDNLEKSPIFAGCDVLDLVEAGLLGKDILKNCKL